ncbi:hypothetical protein QO167_30175, partial [Pseudomonas aeruginosa]|nr:hypothetical protein [Pseudomonas aeruginosa]
MSIVVGQWLAGDRPNRLRAVDDGQPANAKRPSLTMRVAGVLFRYGIAEEGDAVIEVEEVLCFLSECLG